MANRTIYVPEASESVWIAAKEIALQESRSLSTLIGELLHGYVSAHPLDETTLRRLNTPPEVKRYRFVIEGTSPMLMNNLSYLNSNSRRVF